MTENLFEDTNPDGPPQIDETKNYLEELVGENKKFKDYEALAKGKYQADLFVEHMKNRMDELRKDYLALQADNNTKARLEDLIKSVREEKISSNNTNPDVNDIQDKKPFDPKELDDLVDKRLKSFTLEQKRQENFNTVRKQLEEKWGPNYQTALQNTIKQLDLDINDVNELAHKSPKAFFRTLGLDSMEQRQSFQAPPQSSQRTGFSPTTQKRTWTYYQELKKKNPQAYWDPKTNTQMLKDAIALGDEFKDGDYKRFGDD